MTVHRTIKLDDTIDAKLRALAEIKRVAPEDLVEDVLAQHLDYKHWFHAEVQKGIDDLDAGRVLTHEEVLARSAKRREELLARDQ